ncbi:MAG: hypothetical protein MN733_31490, partial [Nitrososphaera sp.]|nr:hypothetical protein [Nitrososphaera sp.]
MRDNTTPLHDHLIQLVNFVHQNPTVQQPILDAFDNDTNFYNHLNDPTFRFKFNTKLNAATQTAVRP